MTSKKTEQKYPQLQSIRLLADYAWIAKALERQPEGRAGAVRAVLSDVLGKHGNPSLDVRRAPATGIVAEIPPTRLVAGYEHIPEAVEKTRAAVANRVGFRIDGADVLRWALWEGLARRGVKTPRKPLDIYAEVMKRKGLRQAELAAEFGLTQSEMFAVRKRLGLVVNEASKPLTGKRLRTALRKDLSQEKAAKLLGVSQKTIALTRERNGYVAPPERAVHANRYDAAAMARIRKIALRTDLTYVEASKRAGVSEQLIYQLREEAGLTKERPTITERQRQIALRIDLTYQKAAELAGISDGTVHKIRREAGITGQPQITPRQRAIALREDLTYAEAAELSGLGLSTIGAIRRESGVTRPHAAVTPKTRAIALRTDLTYAEAVGKSGLSPATVNRLRREAGLTRPRKKS